MKNIPNKSKSYILPLFSKYVELDFLDEIYNTYCYNEEYEDECFIIVYTKSDDKEFKNYIDELKNNKYILNITNYEEYIVVIFNIPQELKKDYNNFLEGKFSKINKHHKMHILKFLVDVYGKSDIKVIREIEGVLYKKETLRKRLEEELEMSITADLELSSIPDTNRETFYLEYVKNL